MKQSKMLMTYLAACSLALITTGCSTVKNGIGLGDPNRMVDIEEFDTTGNEIKIPLWFLNNEEVDDARMVVTATDISKDMQFAIDKATLNATIQLAAKLETDVTSLVRESTLETGFGDKAVDRQIDRVSKATTTQKVAYYKRDNMKIVRDGDYFRCFVMLSLEVDEARKLTEEGTGRSRNDMMNELESLSSNVQQSIDQTVVRN
tara:strand:+ start:1143 stop:1754 length:612 start_codon:yes stop_codon:yes gene_type:complete